MCAFIWLGHCRPIMSILSDTIDVRAAQHYAQMIGIGHRFTFA
jgi:hypothetical protein